MRTKRILILGLISIIFLMVVGSSYADSHLPANLLKILEHNEQTSQNIALKVYFFVAFVAGVLAILSPCVLPFLPAYFSYTFKEKKNITFMTTVFFVGFSITFIVMGIIAGFLGSRAMSVVQPDWLMLIVGLFIIGLGVMSILGIGFSSLFSHSKKKFSNDIPGTFLFGIFFALGWSACQGVILTGILGIGALLHNPLHSAFLLFFYSLGNAIPLFVLAIFYDKFNLANSKFIKGRMFNFTLGGKNWEVHSTNLISGILFFLLGIVIIIFKGTSVVNTWDFFRTKQYFYSLQDSLLVWKYANILSIILFILFIGLIGFFLWRHKKKISNNND